MQDLVDDYLDPEASSLEQRSERAIPVKHRSKSLMPVSPTFEHVAFGDDRQLELKFKQPEQGTESAVCFVPGRPGTIDVSAAHSTDSPSDTASKVIAARRARSLGQSSNELASRFTVRGFLCGCAIGAAAAALILMIVQTAL